MNVNCCRTRLLRSRKVIFTKLSGIIQTYKDTLDYTTFGKEIEKHVTKILVAIFTDNRCIQFEKDYKIAKDKNEFPDFLLLSVNPILAIEIKSGNRSKLKKGKWVPCNNSENDMGTFNKWPEKLARFDGNNIIYIFIEYNFNSSDKKLVDIKIAPFYKFIGLTKAGFLKYREKDGNLRPKDFDQAATIDSLEEFNALIPKTIIYRSARIIKKHWKNIPKSERPKLIQDLINN